MQSSGAPPQALGAGLHDAAFSDDRRYDLRTRSRMNSRTLPPSTDAGARERSARAPAPAAARAALALLPRLRAGTLSVHTPDGAMHHATGASRPELHATLKVLDWSVFAATLRTGATSASPRPSWRANGRRAAPGRPVAAAAGQPRRHRGRPSMVRGGAQLLHRVVRTRSIETPGTGAVATSARTTISATRSTRCGSTRR